MKKLVLVLTLACVALAGTASAGDGTWQNNIGVYADQVGFQNMALLPVETPMYVYLLLTNTTTPAINGWEAKITAENIEIIQVTLYGDAIDAATRDGEYIVGLGTPMPTVDRVAVLARLRVLMTEFVHDPSVCSYIFIKPVYFHVLPESAPAYIDAEGVAQQAHQSTIDGHVDGPVFWFNCNPVAVENETWGSVKSLYR